MKKKIFSLLLLILVSMPVADPASAAAPLTDNACTSIHGLCYDSRTSTCSTGFKVGLCRDGVAGVGASRQCCTVVATTGLTNDTCTGNDEAKIFGECIRTDSLDGMMGLGLAATRFMLGMVGSLALLAFVWGGFQMIMAAGDLAKVKKGRDSIMAAVIGLVVVFTSYILVQFIMESLLGVK